jgi:hypothetical protein
MKTKTILIGAGIAAAVVGVVWYVRGKKGEAASKDFVDYVQTGKPNSSFPATSNPQPATPFDPSKFGYDPNRKIDVALPNTAPILVQKRLPAPEVITNGYNRYQRDTQMAGFRGLLS